MKWKRYTFNLTYSKWHWYLTHFISYRLLLFQQKILYWHWKESFLGFFLVVKGWKSSVVVLLLIVLFNLFTVCFLTFIPLKFCFLVNSSPFSISYMSCLHLGAIIDKAISNVLLSFSIHIKENLTFFYLFVSFPFFVLFFLF